MVTIKDIAKVAGVSAGTVSKVINGYTNLSQDTIDKVNRIIDEMEFQPNQTAKSMRTKKTNMIGIIVPNVGHPFFSELYVELQKKFFEYNYGCFVFSTSSDEKKEISALKAMLIRQVDGILYSSIGWEESTTQSLIEIGDKVPLVSLNRVFPNSAIKSVNIDYYSGVLKAMEHLISKGHRRIAFIYGHAGSVAGDARMRAYREALMRHDIPFDEKLVAQGMMDVKSGYTCAREIIRNYPLPSAIVAGNDAMAIGAIKYLKEKRIRIPNEMAVVGFDDIEWSKIFDPSLTTLQPFKERIAEIIAEMLLGDYPDTDVLLDPELIIRNSTDIDVEAEIDW